MSEKSRSSYKTAFHPLYPSVFRVFAPLVACVTRLFSPNFRVTGRHNIPRRGAVIFVANHISDADPVIIGLALRRPLHWMAKRELWTWDIISPFLTFLAAFPVDPSSPDRAALKKAEEVIAHDEGLGMFPEGEISLDSQLQHLMPGAVRLALKSGAPVIPVGIEGTQYIIPYAKLWPRPTLRPVRIHFGPRIDFHDLAELPSKAARQQASERLESALKRAIERAKQ